MPLNSTGGALEDEPIDESLILDAEGFTGERLDMSESADGVSEHQVEARRAKSPPTPMLPSAKDIAAHNLTHAVYRSWCPFCVAGRRPNSAHRRVMGERQIPLLVGDFAFLRTTNDDDSLTVFVGKVMPQRVVIAMGLDQKGATPENVSRLAKFIRSIGLTRFAYKSDQEKAITSLIDAAAIEANRTAIPEGPTEDIVAASELSSVGESASNGLAERTVQSAEDMMRTLKLALESRMNTKLPVKHPVMYWLVEHSAAIMTKYHVGPDGTTGYAQLHGRECTEKLVEFGERIMFYVPKKIRAKLDPRWRYGIWLGRSINVDESYVATSDGRVTRARAIVRLIESARWDATKILSIKSKPGDKFVDGLEHVEEEVQPHVGLDEQTLESEDDAQKKAQMRMRITLRDLEKYGFTKGCPRCNMHKLGKTSGVNHSEECRLRIYQAMSQAKDSKLQRAKNLGLDEKDLLEPQQVEDKAVPETFDQSRNC